MLIGTYNTLTKTFNLIYGTSYQQRSNGWATTPSYVDASLYVDMEGKAGSYRQNVTVYINDANENGNYYSFLCFTTSWEFW